MDTEPQKPYIEWNPDILGLAFACLSATITLAIGFWRGVDGFSIAVRVALVFLISYAITFVLVLCVTKIVERELEEWRRLNSEPEPESEETTEQVGEK
jgi:hypothetical protein